RLEQRAGRAFAVGAADDEKRRAGVAAEALAHLAHALEAHLDGLRVDALDVLEPPGKVFRGRAQLAGPGWRCSSVIRLASLSRIWRRSTIRSMAPFSNRNSARWKPSGSFSRTVCSITRGPAKPISARGSAITISPSIAKLADTPPMVGSVSRVMNGSLRCESSVSAAVVFA